MNDKTFRDIVYIGFAAIALWLLMRNRAAINTAQNAAQNAALPAIPQPSLSPIELTYASNPNNFGPTNLNINVAPQLPAGLSNSYIPLFGFVGIAQGEMLQ